MESENKHSEAYSTKLFQQTTLNTWHKNILKAWGQGNFTAKWCANEYLQGK